MAESLQFSIGADTKSFNDGIAGMLGSIAGLVAAFISAQAIVEAFSQAIDMGGRLHDLSTRTGETAGNLAILERAFENTSVGAEKLGPAIAKMQLSMVDLQQGSDKAVAAFTQLGLSWADLEGKSPAEQMELIGIRLAAIQDPALRASTAVDIFGRAGAELLPILTNFSAETEEAKRQLGSLPAQLDATAGAVDSLGDNLSAISNKLTEMAYGFLSEVIPAVNSFVSKLSGIDAASIGAGLADLLIAAFVEPMKLAELLGETMLLGVKLMGNEFVYQVQYWGELLFNTFGAISDDIIPMIGNNMVAMFEMAVASLGGGLASAAEAFWLAIEPGLDALGLGSVVDDALRKVSDLKADADALMVDAAAKIAESANAFQTSFEEAKNNSTVVKQDFFGAEESAAKIKGDFAAIEQSAKDAMDRLDVPVGALAPQSGAEITDADRAAVMAGLKVQQTPVGGTTTTKPKTAAQLQAELNKQLQTIAGAGDTQVIGSSASAQRVLDKQKELAELTALGKGDTAEARALQESIQRNLDIAQGISLTSADQYAAQSWAMDEYLKGNSTMTLDQLEELAEQNILEQKRGGTTSTAEDAKAKEAGAGGKAAEEPKTASSIINSIYTLLQKIEPKLPQHIMS